MTSIGPYRILKRLQMTETSEVLLAVSGDQKVVLKRLLAGVAEADPSMAESLVREATAYARLNHPCVVRMLDFFEEGGRTAMVLEYIEGVTLETVIDDLLFRREKLARAAALHVASNIFSALAAAHSAQEPETRALAPIIHRDVSPGNVLLTRDGDVKLSDFGFAKLLGKDSQATAFGVIKGTFGYMAPEQVLEQPVTIRADVFCGALVAWELLAGKICVKLSGLNHLARLMKMASPDIVPIEQLCADVAPAIAAALERALRTDPDRRDITAAELHEVFKRETQAHLEEGPRELVRSIKRVRSAQLEPQLTVSEEDIPPDVLGEDAPLAPDAEPATPEATPEAQAEATPEAAPAAAPHAEIAAAKPTEGEKRPRRFLAAGSLASVSCIVLVAVLGARRAETRVETPTPVLAPAVIASVTASVAPIETARPPPASDTGEIDTRAAAAGRRVFVDGRVVGNTGEIVRVTCGTRSVQIGSAGSARQVDVPCGGVVRAD